jgi:mRNA-decapping enzyme subunit 2
VASPTLSDATITGRRSTANEITRTLPPKAKAKAPQPKPAHQSYDGSSHENNTERKHSNGQTHAPTITRNQRASSKAKSRPEQQIPQFSILQRPGSSAGKPPPAPQSPLRFEASNSSQASFQPQVLKRPTSAEVPAHETTMKNDNLLNLFNKTDINAPPPAPQSAASPVQSSHSGAQAQQRNNSLLDLLNGRNTPPVLKTPEPPPAPQLPPERKTSQHGNTLHQQKQSNHLLHLFTKPGALQKSTGSPGTPISPFTLGTPATHKPREASFSEQSRETSRSRIGSMTSVRSGMSSGQQTPTEAKDMMLGYLNGVLQKEGLRGSGKKG